VRRVTTNDANAKISRQTDRGAGEYPQESESNFHAISISVFRLMPGMVSKPLPNHQRVFGRDQDGIRAGYGARLLGVDRILIDQPAAV
jgi:hypothetical protein